MSESLIIQGETKSERYAELASQLHSLLAGEADMIARMANVAGALKEAFDWWWVGFYRVIGNQLVLGPYQGPIACTRIAYNRGVCGTAWAQKQTIIVPDVEQFPGHIACSRLSRSEIVVPILINNEVIGVLDIDSEQINMFDEIDEKCLEEIVQIIIH
ncbi:MAG: GAF domain-containing protein [Paludibacteraceae bacterium]|nr:GAF domain-containing protein [Paludibacteraceae bacterium]